MNIGSYETLDKFLDWFDVCVFLPRAAVKFITEAAK
jgi:hypothetical protein